VKADTAGSKPKATLIVPGWGGHSMAAPFNFDRTAKRHRKHKNKISGPVISRSYNE